MILKNNKRIDGCSDTVPIGTLNPFLGSVAPYGYLICQGQKVSKTVYKELYEICGDTFGQSTDTDFYLPDLRGQTIAGYKEGDSTFGTLGGLIGSLTHLHSTGNHTLTVDEMPAHAHGLTQTYDVPRPGGGSGSIALSDWSGSSGVTSYVGGSQPHNHGNTSSTSSVQPTIILNWIVKAFQLMPNQSYVSTVKQESNINTYSCNYINNLTKYSLDGQIVGFWLDGKPAYRQVLTGDISSNGELLIPFPSNLDTLISFDAYAINSQGDMIPAPAVEISYSTGNSYGAVRAIGKNASWAPENFYFVGFNNYVTARVIVTYTKTTD